MPPSPCLCLQRLHQSSEENTVFTPHTTKKHLYVSIQPPPTLDFWHPNNRFLEVPKWNCCCCSVPQLNTLRITRYVHPHLYMYNYRYTAQGDRIACATVFNYHAMSAAATQTNVMTDNPWSVVLSDYLSRTGQLPSEQNLSGRVWRTYVMWHLICVCIAKYVKLDIIATSFSPKQHDTGRNRYHRASGYNISDLVRFWCEPTFARLNMWKQHGRSLHAEAMYNTLLTLRSPLILMLSIGFDCNLT